MTDAAKPWWGATVLSGQATTGDLSPDTLAAAIRAGDEEAFNVFYDRYADRLYRYLFALLPRQEALVRDVFQETMLRVVRYIKPMPDGDVLWGWLTRVARSALYDQLRRRRRQADREFAHGGDIHPDAWPDEEAADARLRTALRAALDNLEDVDRELVEAYYFRGESQADIGLAENTTRKAVESRLARVRKRLKNALQDHLHGENETHSRT